MLIGGLLPLGLLLAQGGLGPEAGLEPDSAGAHG